MRKKQENKLAPARAARAATTRQIRIIGGQWKRTPLVVPDAEGLRPTPDRVRETVFNWLHHLLNGQWENVACLDLFAGTGALGFEAASRGAQRVVMVEADRAAAQQLQATKEKLGAAQITVLRADALETAQNFATCINDANARFNVIFLDPPYHQDWLAKALPVCERLLADDGLVYAEAEQSMIDQAPPGWDVVRADKAGMVFYHLLRRNKAD